MLDWKGCFYFFYFFHLFAEGIRQITLKRLGSPPAVLDYWITLWYTPNLAFQSSLEDKS